MSLTTCRKDCQRIGNLLIHLFGGHIATIDLMINNAVFDKKHAACVACGFGAVCDHDDRLSVFVYGVK